MRAAINIVTNKYNWQAGCDFTDLRQKLREQIIPPVNISYCNKRLIRRQGRAKLSLCTSEAGEKTKKSSHIKKSIAS